jgi:hypothetical protein
MPALRRCGNPDFSVKSEARASRKITDLADVAWTQQTARLDILYVAWKQQGSISMGTNK